MAKEREAKALVTRERAIKDGEEKDMEAKAAKAKDQAKAKEVYPI